MKISEMQRQAWETAEEHGFHKSRDDSTPIALALIHSEVSEALESDRGSGREELVGMLREWADGVDEEGAAETLREAADAIEQDPLGEELADIVIRCGDLAESEGIDLQAEVESKMAENEEREEKHGKEY